MSLLEQIRSVASEFDIQHVSDNAIQPIYNEKDADLTLALCRAALSIASRDGLKTLMLKHCVAAYALYNLCADELSIEAPKITKKAMRERAIAAHDGILTKISPAAIDLIYDKSDPQISHVKWSIAIELATCGAMKESKTLQEMHAETAIQIFDLLKSAIDVVCEDENEDEDDAAINE